MARRRIYVYLSTREFAQLIEEQTGERVTRERAYRWARSGDVPAQRIGGRYYFAVTPPQAARALGVSPSTVRRRVETGERMGAIYRPRAEVGPEVPAERRRAARRMPEDMRDRVDKGEGVPPEDAYGWLERERPDIARDVEEGNYTLEAGLAMARAQAPSMDQWREVTYHVTRAGGLEVIVTDQDGRTYLVRFPTQESALFHGWNLYDKELLAQRGIQVHKRIDSPGKRKGRRAA